MNAADLPWPKPDETLSSWLARWCGTRQITPASWRLCLEHSLIGLADQLTREPDFPASPLWRRVVAQWTGVSSEALEAVGRPSTPWFLAPSARCVACLACLSEDGAPGQQYMRTAWTDSWRTVCQRHDLPLVKVPAIGWRWGDLTPTRRRVHAGLMHLPGALVPRLRRGWSELPLAIRRGAYALEIALLEAWAEQCAMGHPDAGEAVPGSRLRVWQDLLTLCSVSWGPLTEASLAGAALPARWVDRSAFLRVPRVAPLSPSTPAQLWRHWEDPAERRTLLLCVGDAVLGLSSERATQQHERRRPWGWPAVLPHLPETAMRWVLDRSEAWPVVFRYEAQNWLRIRKRTRVR
ncbi:MAG: TniQ family protein [Rhodanobacteraceae bacterium]|nr:TniQ family protein [Rhodanobacteraceae bacterium]